MNKVTDAEIVERLCSCDSYFDCDCCPYEAVCNGLGDLTDKTLDLIERKDKRIEALTAENNRQKAEIERLEAESDMADGYEEALVGMTKTEAIKEFAERLKEQFDNLEYRAKTKRKTVSVDYLDSQMNWVLHEVSSTLIDDLVKEMVGD